MRDLKKLFLVMAFCATVLPLSGCETVDSTLASVQEQWDKLDLSIPNTQPRNSDSFVDDDRMASGARSGGTAANPEPASYSPASETVADDSGITITQSGMADDGTVMITSASDCPAVTAVPELAQMHQFTNPAKPQPDQKISEVALDNVKSSCKATGGNLAVDLELAFDGRLGPAVSTWSAERPTFAYPYFIAITAPNGTIIAKEVFALTLSYEKGRQQNGKTEKIRQVIPMNGVYGAANSLMVGFQLSDSELAYNRALLGQSPLFLTESSGPPPEKAKPAPVKKAAAKPMKVTPPRKPDAAVADTAVPAAVEAEAVPAPAPEAVTAEPVAEPAATAPAAEPVAAESAPAEPAPAEPAAATEAVPAAVDAVATPPAAALAAPPAPDAGAVAAPLAAEAQKLESVLDEAAAAGAPMFSSVLPVTAPPVSPDAAVAEEPADAAGEVPVLDITAD